jgi:hypothetical protein
VRNIHHLEQLERCISSIRTYHPLNPIYIINDSSEEWTSVVIDILKKFSGIENFQSIKKGSADQQVFRFIKDIFGDNNIRWVILQDSMMINEELKGIEQIEHPTFLLHFTNHRVQWDVIREPITEENLKNNIVTHTDLIRYYINSYTQNNIFKNYALEGLNKKETWVGCFGNLSIVTKEEILKMDKKVPFIDQFINSTGNRERRVNESIYSLICHFCYPDVDFSKSYDNLYFDGIHVNKYYGQPTGFGNLTWCFRNKYISKVSFNR